MKTQSVMTAAEAHEQIERQAKTNAVPEVRRIRAIEVGKVVRQGDIYLHRVEAAHLKGKRRKDRQLALGNTMGSRHVAEAPAECYEGVQLPSWCDERTFLGPLIKSEKRFTVTHPEHAHVELPAGTYQVTHQMDARTMERVRD
jgi:hypothetical protein